ncbi:hypothetical protein FACS189473_4160 [Spirochaetia bacterium]|nr:hypothetical protein FACS189473_4160 [Spirochaetia bacterium]
MIFKYPAVRKAGRFFCRPMGDGSGRALALCLCLLALTVSCNAQGKRLESRDFILERADGGPPAMIRAEIARTDDQRSRGLMNRESLPDGEGMLFVFTNDEIRSFWMKNTLIPLSIAYIGYNGLIHEIRDMQPLDTTSVSSRRSARYALEVPQGWFGRVRIKAGDRLILGDF